MLSAAGVQRSGTPAESKHPYPGTTAASRDDAATSAADGAGSGVAALIPRVLTLMEEDSPVATNTTVMLSAAGVQRSGAPAESKHPYPGTTAASRVGAATSAADGAGSGVAALIPQALTLVEKDCPVATNTTVMLSAAGVQRSGTPAESKHPYPRTTAASRDDAATNAADCALAYRRLSSLEAPYRSS